MTMGKRTEAELADHYTETEDLSEFDEKNAIPVTVKRSVTIPVRFSDDEIAELRTRAERAGVKVTSFIRAAALDASNPVDRAQLSELTRDLEQRVHRVGRNRGGGLRTGHGGGESPPRPDSDVRAVTGPCDLVADPPG